jgi:putative transcriptional regulator
MMERSAIEVAHETVKGLHNIGLVDKMTMHKFDAMCLPEIDEMGPKEIKKIRTRANVSQPILAMYLNVSPYTVKHWERGEKHPSGAALKLLNLVARKGLEAVA